MKIEIWDKISPLKGIEKEVWFNAYPQAKNKTLALIDNVEVLFLEDINCTNEDEVKAYIEKRKEEAKKQEAEEKSEVEKLKAEIEKIKLENAKAIAELTEKSESDKLELSTAIVEAVEQMSKQGE